MIAVVLWAAVVLAQAPQVISEVRVEQEGQVLDDRVINSLIETRPGEPLSMGEVRETLTHLTSLNRFEDVQVFQEPAGAGVRLRYVLFPLHPVDRMDFRGALGLSADELRRVFTERFGAAPSAGRAEEVADAMRLFYRERGYPSAEVMPRIEETHNPDRATMIFEIRAGSRASIGRVEVDEVDSSGRAVAGGVPIRVGDPFDNDEILRELNRYVAPAARARLLRGARRP